jgi:hypothetical protein
MSIAVVVCAGPPVTRSAVRPRCPRSRGIGRCRRIPPFAALGVRQSLLFLRELGKAFLIVLAVVVLLAIDVDTIRDRVGAEGVMVPDDDVRVLADLERADAIVVAKLLRGVDRDERERLVF